MVSACCTPGIRVLEFIVFLQRSLHAFYVLSNFWRQTSVIRLLDRNQGTVLNPLNVLSDIRKMGDFFFSFLLTAVDDTSDSTVWAHD